MSKQTSATKEFGYNPALKQISEQMKEVSVFLDSYVAEYLKSAPNDTTLQEMRFKFDNNFCEIALNLGELVAFEFRDNTFYHRK